MSTLDTLIQHLKELREAEGKDIPLYLVDQDDREAVIPSEFKEWLRVGHPGDPRSYRDDLTRSKGLLMRVF